MDSKKYVISGAILAISMLLAISVLSPSVAAYSIIQGGYLETTVDSTGTMVSATATEGEGVGAIDGYTIHVITQVTWDDDYNGGSSHYWYLHAKVVGGGEDEDEDGFTKQQGTSEGSTTLTAIVQGWKGCNITIYIYCEVQCGPYFKSDDAQWNETVFW